MERLQKVIASSGFTSRRKAEELIKNGKVSVNGSVVTELGTKVSYEDSIVVDGTLLKKETNKFFMCFSLLSQFTVAYMLSFIVYQAMRKGIGFAVVISVVISLIMFALFTVRKRFMKKCNGRCVSCSCNKKS